YRHRPTTVPSTCASVCIGGPPSSKLSLQGSRRGRSQSSETRAIALGKYRVKRILRLTLTVKGTPLAVGASPLEHADRAQARDAGRKPRSLHDGDDALDVLVGLGRLLRQAPGRRRANGDALCLKALAERAALDLLADRGPRHT